MRRTQVTEQEKGRIRTMVYAGMSFREVRDFENGVSNPIHGATLKALYQSFVNTSPLATALAELEALDWWPVTEKPPASGLYQTASFLATGVVCELSHTYWNGEEWEDDGVHFLIPDMTHYRRITRPRKSTEAG